MQVISVWRCSRWFTQQSTAIGAGWRVIGDSISSLNSCADRKLQPTNVGQQIMLKHGWTEGKGMGAYAHGRLEPSVPTGQMKRTTGVGFRRHIHISSIKAEQQLKVQHC